MDVHAFVYEAAVELSAASDPRAVGAAVTVALCGHWEHDGPCRWPHNNDLAGRSFRTLYVCTADEEPEVRARIRTALHSTEWRVTSEGVRAIADEERALAERLIATPRRRGPADDPRADD